MALAVRLLRQGGRKEPRRLHLASFLHHIGIASSFAALYRKLQYKTSKTSLRFPGMINEVPMTIIGKPQS
jgi:hypothetical protein